MPRSKKTRGREVMVVPVREEAFAIARKIHLYAVPIVRSTSDVKYIAFYRGAPTSAITHYAKVEKISKNLPFREVFPRSSDLLESEDKPMKVYHLGPLEELSRRVKKGWNPPVSGPRYTKLDTIKKARYLDEVWPSEEPAKGKRKAKEPAKGKRKAKEPAKGKRKVKEKVKKAAEEPKKAPSGKKRKRGKGKKEKKKEEEPSVHYIVDGSNVALEARSFKEGGRLRQIEMVMDKLSEEEDAAITVLVDANLRHHIDRKDDMEKMIKDRTLLQAPAQTDADEFILMTAEALRSRGERVIVVSNDRYQDYIKRYKPRFDWVKKAQQQFMFVFSQDGSKAIEVMFTLS